MNQIPGMFFINIEHDIIFGNDATIARALSIKIACKCLIY